jgi:mRNA export factor
MDNQIILYPINSVGFNPIKDAWFMTAGSDGMMHFWDFDTKTKIKSLSYDSPICCSRVNPRGDMLAYALGNDWHTGQEGIK